MKFVHFAWSWVRYQYWRFRGWRVTVPQKIADYRFEEGCKLCPHYQDGECLKCGCLAQAKVILASEKCPRGFWMSVKIKRADKPGL